jgi:hypothetical protein
MSPNLTPADEEYEEHALIYEQLIYNTLNIVGASSYYEMVARLVKMLVHGARKKIC